jgi:hypothetical protein
MRGVNDPFRTYRKDVTDWVIRRVHADKTEEELWWGLPGEGVLHREWPLAELSHKTVRSRWGPGSYRVYFTGHDETGRRRPRGRTEVITLTPLPGDPRPPPPPGMPPPVPLSVVEALRAGGNAALADKIEHELNVFGVFVLRRGM